MQRRFNACAGIMIVICCLSSGLVVSAKEDSSVVSASVFFEVHFCAPVKLSHLRPGELLQGKVAKVCILASTYCFQLAAGFT